MNSRVYIKYNGILCYLKNNFILLMDNIRSILLVKNIFIFQAAGKNVIIFHK